MGELVQDGPRVDDGASLIRRDQVLFALDVGLELDHQERERAAPCVVGFLRQLLLFRLQRPSESRDVGPVELDRLPQLLLSRGFTTIIDGYDWDVCQIQYNLLDQECQAGTTGLRQAASRRIGVVVMEPLRGGGLAQVPDPVEEIWKRYPVARTPAEWALRWVWDHAELMAALSGMNSASQVRENLAIAAAARAGTMGAGELAPVDEVRGYYRAKMKVACTTCGCCIPCPNGVAIPDIFSFYNTSAMFDAKDRSGAWYRAQIVPNDDGASACLECGDCEPKCPQAIPIPEKLKEAHAHLAD